MNNKVMIMVISIGLLFLVSILGIAFAFILNDEDVNMPVSDVNSSVNDTADGSSEENPAFEFADGSEDFFDESVAIYIERMSSGVPAIDDAGNYYYDKDGNIVYDLSGTKKMDGVMNNLIAIVNYFADKEYSMDASHQIQRFYVMYYDRLPKTVTETFMKKLAVCFPVGGANPEMLGETVFNTFGIKSRDDCLFVFEPIAVSEIKVEFYNVIADDVELTEELEYLCIYDYWRNEVEDNYERNLEVWLRNIISCVSKAGFDEEKIIVAQILYAGSIADAEYRSDWEDSLIRCLSIEVWNFDSLKEAVEKEFSVSLDYNVSLQEYFESFDSEV